MASFADVRPSPPVCSLKQKLTTDLSHCLQQTVKELNFVQGIWKDDSKLTTEHNFLKKRISCIRYKHRSQKLKGYLERVHRGVAKLKLFNLPSALATVLSMCPSVQELNRSPIHCQLPSQQLFFFLQHKMHKAAELIKYLLDSCTNAYIHMSQIVGHGYFVSAFMLQMSNISSIWYILRAYLKSLINVYPFLQMLTPLIKSSGSTWECDLPSTLNDFLNLHTIIADSQAHNPDQSPRVTEADHEKQEVSALNPDIAEEEEDKKGKKRKDNIEAEESQAKKIKMQNEEETPAVNGGFKYIEKPKKKKKRKR